MTLGFGTAPAPASPLRPIPGQPGLFRYGNGVWRRVGGTRMSPTLVRVRNAAPSDLGSATLGRGAMTLLVLGLLAGTAIFATMGDGFR